MIPLNRLNDGLGDPGGIVDDLGGSPAVIAVIAAILYVLFGR